MEVTECDEACDWEPLQEQTPVILSGGVRFPCIWDKGNLDIFLVLSTLLYVHVIYSALSILHDFMLSLRPTLTSSINLLLSVLVSQAQFSYSGHLLERQNDMFILIHKMELLPWHKPASYLNILMLTVLVQSTIRPCRVNHKPG